MVSLLIGVMITCIVGAICFWVIDKFVNDGRLAMLLKLLVVLVCLGSILQRVLPLRSYMNVATAMADGGKRTVLLIDADLHHSAVSELLGLDGRPGLAESLQAGLDPMSAVRRLEPLAWYVLPAGHAGGNPAEVLQSAALPGLIATLSAQFDWVVIDSPPVAPLSDALSLKKETEGTLLVVRAGSTPSEAVEQTMALIGREHVLGIVLNGVEGLDRLYSKYSKYYRSKA